MTWFKRLFWTVILFDLVVAAGVWATWEPDRQLGALVARWATPPSSFVELDGMQVHVRDTGPRDDPMPIVLMHGMASSLHTYDGWQKSLQTQRRVITFDLPGFGLTGPSPQGEYRIEAYTRFVLRMLDTLGVKQVILGGNALGGEIAWQTALLAPERVKKLVLIDSDGYPVSPLSQPLAFQIASAKGLRWISERILPRSVVASSVRDVFGDPTHATAEQIDRYFELNLRVGNRRALFQRMDQSEPGAKAHLIRQIRQPALVIWGGLDAMQPSSSSDQFCREIPRCTNINFPMLGHIPQEEDPKGTLAPLLRFLAKPL